MSAVRMLAGYHLRRRGRAVVAFVVLVGLVGTVVLASLAGARRTGSALERFKSDSRAATVQVLTGFDAPTAKQLRAFRRLPEVSSAAVLEGFAINVPASPKVSPTAAVDPGLGTVVDRARVVAGRAANPRTVDEITIGENLAEQLHRGVGGHLDAVSFTPGQVRAILGGSSDPGSPAGPRLRFRIVGIVRRPEELGRQGALGGVILLTPAFTREYSHRIGAYGFGLRVRTRRATPDIGRLKREALQIFGPSPLFSVQSAAGDSEGTQNAIDVLVVALCILAGVATLAGVVTLGIVVSRDLTLGRREQDTMRALGLTRVQRIAVHAPTALVIAFGGAVVASIGTIATSPLFPIGVARRAEPDPGLWLDWTVIAAGFAAVVLIVLTISLIAEIRASRTSSPERAVASTRSPGVAERARRRGLSPAATAGLDLALRPGRGRAAIPIRSALAGAVFGIMGVAAVVVFAGSLHRLVTTPRRYGWTWDFSATDTLSAGDSCSHDVFGLLKAPGVGAVAVACYGTGNVQLDGHPVNGWGISSLRGHIDPLVVRGRAPRGPREVALGSATLHHLGKSIGDHVRASGPHAHAEYRIVGQAVFPTLSQTQPVADGAVFTGAGFAPLLDQENYYRYVVGRFAPGADRAAVDRRIAALPELDAPVGPAVPVEIDRLEQVNWLPTALAVLVAALAFIAMAHAAITTVRRRRRDLAVLKVLGFRRRQVRATVAWQATTVATLALVVGVPAGVVLGSLVWRIVADGVGVDATAVLPGLALIAMVPAVLALANLTAYLPARAAARTPASTVLHRE